LIDPEGIKEAVTLVGGILGILLALDRVIGRLRRKSVLVSGKRWGDQYYAYLIFNEPIALTSFTLDVFAGENLLRKAFYEHEGQRLLVKARDQITVTIDLGDPNKGSIEVELFHGARRLVLGSGTVTAAVLDTAMAYEYLNKEIQVNIGYLFKGTLEKSWYKLSVIGRKLQRRVHPSR